MSEIRRAPASQPVSMIAEISDHIRDLTRPHVETEAYTYDLTDHIRVERHHRAHVPPLLTQLGAGKTDTSTNQSDGPGTYDSKPPAGIDALDIMARIDLAASRWVRDLTGEWSEPNASTADVVALVGALAASCEDVQQRAIARSVRGWWVAARVATGWDTAPWTPDATCPACEKRGTLRVRLADRVAACTQPDCHAWWDVGTIGLLADHIRHETMGREAAGRAPRCQVLGDYEPEDLEFQCRGCGSARCVRALGERLKAVAGESREWSLKVRQWRAWAASRLAQA